MENPVPLINEKNETFLTDADLFRPSKTPNDKLNKTPAIKKAKLLSKISDKEHYENHENKTLDVAEKLFKKQKKKQSKQLPQSEEHHKSWNETKIYVLPLMPSDAEEKYLSMDKEYRCAYCDELCDQENLECKVCSKVAHCNCLYKRGFLNRPNVSLKSEWTCADCADLSKLLTDEEMQKIINVFEKLDFRKNCYVKFADYLEVKRKLYEEENDAKMTYEIEIEEFRRFRLIDSDQSNAITWNEFVEFETSNLLAKKNKVELSNHLSKKELIVAKRKFLSFDKNKMKMITKEDAKLCYMEYFKKLKEKLGNPFLEHISNCADLFGFKDIDHNKSGSTAKTMWPEFIRKLTILLLYDRLNTSSFQPASWKPGPWFQSSVSNESASTASGNSNSQQKKNALDPVKFNPNIARISTAKRNLLPDESSKQVTEASSFFDVSLIMSQNMSLESFKPYESSDFGSHQYIIRSKQFHSNQTHHGHHNHYKHEILQSEDEDESLNRFPRLDFNHKLKTKRKKPIQVKEMSANLNNWIEKSATERLTETETQSSTENLESQSKLLNNSQIGNSSSFEYSKVTDDIYKTFGRVRKAIDYPQQVTILSKVRPIKVNEESSLKNFYIPDLLENIKVSKQFLNGDKTSVSGNSSSNRSTNNEREFFSESDKWKQRKPSNYRQNNSNNARNTLNKIQIDLLY